MEGAGQSSKSSAGAQDIEMEDVGNTRKRHNTSNSDVEVEAKIARRSSYNAEILDVLEQVSAFGDSSLLRQWFEMYMPNGHKTIVRLEPSVTTQELTRRLENHFGDKYMVKGVFDDGVKKLEYEWSMQQLETFDILTVVVEK